MKIKRILLLASATLLASCANSSNTSAGASSLKEAANAEANKTNVRYDISGDASIKGVYDTQTILDGKVTNLDAEINLKNLNGGILKAKSSDYRNAEAYLDGSVNTIDFKTYDKDSGTLKSSFSALAGNATGYLKSGNLYGDLSKLDIKNALWNGISDSTAPSKVLLENIVDRFSLEGIGFSGFNFTTNEIESYVLKYCTYATSGNAQTATLSLDAEKIHDIYVAVNIANWITYEKGQVPESEQDRAMVAAKNRYTNEIKSIVPSFKLDIALTYDSTGLYSAGVDFEATISPNAAKADEDKKYVYTYDVDLSLKSRNNTSFPEIDFGSYTKVNY